MALNSVIKYHFINSFIAGLLVFLGYFVGNSEAITLKGVLVSLAASLIVCISKFKDFWESSEKELV
jgi:hypothetical protein